MCVFVDQLIHSMDRQAQRESRCRFNIFECSASAFLINGSCPPRVIACTDCSVHFVTAAATESRHHHQPKQHHLAPVLFIASGARSLENSEGIGKLTQWGTGKTPEGGTNSERSCGGRGKGRRVSKNITRQTSVLGTATQSSQWHQVLA